MNIGCNLLLDCFYLSIILTWTDSQSNPKKRYIGFDLPRIRTQNGQLYIEAGSSGNGSISLKASSVKLGEDDLITFIDAAKKIPAMSGQIDSILNQMGITGSDTTENTTRNTAGSTQEVISGRKLRNLQRKIRTLEQKQQEMLTLLNKDECLSSPCKNGATCIDKYNGFTCLCDHGWEGVLCADDVDECVLFDGTDLGCQNGGTCINTDGSFNCSCPPAWHGLHCTAKRDDCSAAANSELCGAGTCISAARTDRDAPSYSCICDPGWTKGNWSNAPCTIDINECASAHIPCSQDPPVPCVNTPGSFHCGPCPTGYRGNGITCTDVNECLVDNGGCSTDPLVTCINTVGSFYCGVCPIGYQGDGVTCTPYGSTCATNNGGCHPNAVCTLSLWGYPSCRCKPGYTGTGVGASGCRPATSSNPCDSSPCQNGGYCMRQGSSYACLCVAPWNGTNCDNYMQACGGNLTGPSGRFSSPSELAVPHAAGDETYRHNSNCTWTITVEPNEVVWLKFLTFQLEHQANCNYDYVEVRDPAAVGNKNGTLARLCGKDVPSAFTSLSNRLVVSFVSDNSVAFGGFIAIYTAIEESKVCGGELRQASGTIKSPGYPEDYPTFSSCVWTITAQDGNQIVMNITDLDLEKHEDCHADYLEIRNGGSENSPLFGRYCGKTGPIIIKSHTNKMFIRFISDRFRNAKGFKASYYSTPTGCNGIMRAPFGAITSPNYPSPYYHNSECYWQIHAAAGSSIQATVVDFDLENSVNCKYDYLAFFDGPSSTSKPLDKLCGTAIPQKQVISTYNEMYIKFRTDLSSHGRGFHLTYQAVCQKRVLKQRSGVIESPGYPDRYPPDARCDYRIEVPRGNKINVTFSHFGIVGVGNCSTDYLAIYDSGEDRNPVGRYCGNSPPKPFQSSSNILYVKFNSDSTGSGPGFRLEWVTHGCGGDINVDRRDSLQNFITSPKYPGNYPPSTTCEWRLMSTEYGYGIMLNITHIDLESHSNCRWDKLEIFNGPDDKSPQVSSVCHSQNGSQTLTSSSPYLFVRFQSDQSKSGMGFKAYYSLVKSDCGGNFSTPKGMIESVNYGSVYPKNLNCGWLITVAEQHVVELNVTDLDVDVVAGDLSNTDCGDGTSSREYLAAYDGEGLSAPLLFRRCGEMKNKTFKSSSNKLFLQFISNEVQDPNKRGFRVNYATGCGAVLEATSAQAEFVSPNFPSRYSKNSNCSYIIKTNTPGTRVTLQFTFMDIEERGSCTHDYLEIRNGDSISAPLIGKYCGRKIPPPIMSTGNALHFRFVTDDWKEEAGWRALYSNSYTACGGEMSALEGFFTSPRYPDNYPTRVECIWTIRASPGNTVDLNFLNFIVGDNDDDPHCNIDYVEIREGSSSGPVLGRYCGDEVPTNHTSGIEVLWIMLRVSGDQETHSGFSAEYRLRHGGEIFGKSSGQIASPLYPMNYPHNSTFTWRVTSPSGTTIRVRFVKMDMEDRRCYFDYLALYNGPTTLAPIIGKYCGFELPEPIQTASNQLFIFMHTDRYGGNGQGFLLEWESVSAFGKDDTASSGSAKIHTMDLTANRKPQRLVAPGYPLGLLPNQTYVWKIRADDTSHVVLNINDISLGGSNSTQCDTKPRLQFSEGTTYRRAYINMCGSYAPQPLRSTTNNPRLSLETGAMPFNATGFNLTYHSACGASIFSSVGQIQSDDYPLLITSTDTTENLCIWNITTDFGATFNITFDDLDLTQSPNCRNHFVQLRNGFGADSPLLGQSPYCGSSIPPPLQTRSNRFELRYYKAASVAGSQFRGFSLRYRVMRMACGGELKLTDFIRSGTFATPNYPENYPTNTECEWTIVAPGGERVRLDFVDKFELERQNNNACPWDYVEVRDGATPDATLLGSYCGVNRPGSLRSRSNVMYVKFRSDRGLVHTGFRANFSIDSCGGTVVDQFGSVNSPNYPQSYGLSNKFDCEWYIQVPDGHFINFELKEFALPPVLPSVGSNCSTSSSVVEVREQNRTSGLPGKVIKSLCGSQLSGLTFASADSQAYIQFKSGPSPVPLLTTDVSYKFRIAFSAGSEVCGGTLSTGSGIITSPGFPNAYPNNRLCVWKIEALPGRRVLLEILEFDVEGYGFCQSDYVEVLNGGLADSPRLERLCGSKWTVPDKISSSMNLMTIKFQTDGSKSNRGFKLRYSTFQPATCGGVLESTSGVITSPGFDWKNASATYRANEECIWVINNPKDARQSTINLQFTHFELENTSPALMPDNCRSDFVEIRSGSTAMDPIVQTLCGTLDSLKGGNLIMPGAQIWLRFRTDYSHQLRGFRLVYNITECGGVLDTVSGLVQSPNYPLNYPNNMSCAWLIQSSEMTGAQVQLTFRDIKLEESTNCSKDSLEILNGRFHTSPRINDLICGTPAIPAIRSQGSALFLRFRSDDSGTDRGFQASFITVSKGCGGTFHGNTGRIATPGYDELPQVDYPTNTECIWFIIVDVGYHINFTFQGRFDIEKSTNCSKDYVEISDLAAPNDWTSLSTSCGIVTPNVTLSSSNQIRVKFHSDNEITAKGFSAAWTIGCGGKFTDPEGVIVSPGFPGKPNNNLDCRYEITAPPDRPYIKLEFDPNHFDIEGSRRLLIKDTNRAFGTLYTEVLCQDWLIVYGESANNESEAISPGPRVCGGGGLYGAGGEPPQPIISKRKMIIDFHTDFALAGNGFRLMYSTSDAETLNMAPTAFPVTVSPQRLRFAGGVG
ncbi:cubilin-like [Paramacrobiotus metropolitanus]|uniref:cubilin-like n=1 Tax=Paramacrobiotus metropolitanus TaxID=2943436 RepID=UPI0024461E93|nr:cubilin-like [Paramacrobiotus metropolitanus]